MHFDVQFLEKFGVTFRREGETLALKCTLLVTPDLKRVQPRAEWYRDGECRGLLRALRPPPPCLGSDPGLAGVMAAWRLLHLRDSCGQQSRRAWRSLDLR